MYKTLDSENGYENISGGNKEELLSLSRYTKRLDKAIALSTSNSKGICSLDFIKVIDAPTDLSRKDSKCRRKLVET
jgi:hypothetical protein